MLHQIATMCSCFVVLSPISHHIHAALCALECDILLYAASVCYNVFFFCCSIADVARMFLPCFRALESDILPYAASVCYRIRRKASGFSQALGWQGGKLTNILAEGSGN